MNLKIWQKILLIVSLPVLFEIIFVAFLAGLLLRTERVSDQFESSKSALLSYHDAEQGMVESMLPFLSIDLYSDKDFSKEFDSVVERMDSFQQSVQANFGLRSEIKAALSDVPEVFEHGTRVIKRIKEIFRSPARLRLGLVKQMEIDAASLVTEIKPVSERIAKAEAQMHLEAPVELASLRWAISVATAVGLVFSLAISVVVAALFFRNIAKRLEIIEENAQRVAIGKDLQDPLPGQDEIGQLDAALHKAAALILDAKRKEFAILDKSVDVLCSLDRRLRIVDIAESVLKAWHYKADELLGRSILTLLPPLERSRLMALLEEASGSHQEQEFEIETQLSCGDSRIRDILWKISSSQTDKIFYCVAHDVTERRNLARKKQQLISVAGHDLRTPLTSVSSTLALITEGAHGELTELSLKELTKASQSLERLMELVRDLLDLERLDAGKMVLEFNCVSALDVCNAAIDSLSSLAQKFKVTIRPPWQDAAMSGDERRLVQILINFLSNAIKFSPSGGTVVVSIKKVEDFVELSVSDQGAGIPAQDQELIFEKFHQSTAPANAPIKSTGLGLAIAKVLTEGHKGTIGVESEIGKGSRFFIRIPVFEDKTELELEE